MLSSTVLPCQVGFSFQSVPDLQSVACTPDAFDQDALSSSASSNSVNPEKSVSYVPDNYICPEAYAFLAAAEVSAARSALDAGFIDIDVDGGLSALDSASDGMYDHDGLLSRMEPPKKFYRTFWKSVSRRLLLRWESESEQKMWTADTTC